MFDLLPRYESVQEVAEDLSPKIKTLQANLKVIQQFHDVENLHSVALTQTLVQNIMRSLPSDGRSSFNKQFMHFGSLDPNNVRPPATFLFLAQYVNKLEKHYQSNPSLYNLDSSLTNVGIKAVCYETSNAKPKPPAETLCPLNLLAPYAPPKASSPSTTLSTRNAAPPS